MSWHIEVCMSCSSIFHVIHLPILVPQNTYTKHALHLSYFSFIRNSITVHWRVTRLLCNIEYGLIPPIIRIWQRRGNGQLHRHIFHILYCMCFKWGSSLLTLSRWLFPLWNYRKQTQSLHTVHSVTTIQIIAMAMLSVEPCDLWCPNENTQLQSICLSACNAIHLCTSQLWKPSSQSPRVTMFKTHFILYALPGVKIFRGNLKYKVSSKINKKIISFLTYNTYMNA